MSVSQKNQPTNPKIDVEPIGLILTLPFGKVKL